VIQYHFELRNEDTGYSTACCELEGCRTDGDTLAEVYANCVEVLDLCLAPEDIDHNLPMPDDRLDGQPNIIAVPVQPDKETLILSRAIIRKALVKSA
jgi:predicted RNase H-like HicB family nuclease